MLYLLIIPALVLLYGVAAYNSFVRLRNSVEEAFSTMDVYLKKRTDLVPNLVEVVKGYASHEKETLNMVVEARNKVLATSSSQERTDGEQGLSQALGKLFALSESYPELKADTQFLELQKQLKQIEDDISQARKYYNGVVKEMNTRVESFPSNILAGIFHFEKEPFFIIDEEQRGPVQVQF